MAFYFQLFWIPAAASALLLALLWTQGDLSERSLWIAGSWFAAALVAQYLAPTTAVWIAGLALQTALAVYLLLRKQLSEM